MPILLVLLLQGPAWWDAFVDALGGEPRTEELARTRAFTGGGLSFDVPEVLRERRQDRDGAREWSFSRGSFELELHDGRGDLTVGDYLGTLADLLSGGKRLDAEGPLPGRRVTLCGREVESVRVRVRVGDDWTVYEGFDLPAASHRYRWLVFEDEPVAGEPSAVGRAAWAAVLGSLRCVDEARG